MPPFKSTKKEKQKNTIEQYLQPNLPKLNDYREDLKKKIAEQSNNESFRGTETNLQEKSLACNMCEKNVRRSQYLYLSRSRINSRLLCSICSVLSSINY